MVATSALESLQTLAKSFFTEDAVQRSQFTGLLLPVVAEIFRSQQLHWRLIFAALSAIPFLLQVSLSSEGQFTKSQHTRPFRTIAFQTDLDVVQLAHLCVLCMGLEIKASLAYQIIKG